MIILGLQSIDTLGFFTSYIFFSFNLFLDYSSDMTLGFFISYIYLSFSFDKKIKLRPALRILLLLEFNNEFRQLSAFDIKKILNEPFDNSKIRKSFIIIHFYDGFVLIRSLMLCGRFYSCLCWCISSFTGELAFVNQSGIPFKEAGRKRNVILGSKQPGLVKLLMTFY